MDGAIGQKHKQVAKVIDLDQIDAHAISAISTIKAISTRFAL